MSEFLEIPYNVTTILWLIRLALTTKLEEKNKANIPKCKKTHKQ